uniref:Secreted protein n=1 Tax=Mesocestoides corti TaxID=53468 RepID=A0A5K3G1H9_MESCO
MPTFVISLLHITTATVLEPMSSPTVTLVTALFHCFRTQVCSLLTPYRRMRVSHPRSCEQGPLRACSTLFATSNQTLNTPICRLNEDREPGCGVAVTES